MLSPSDSDSLLGSRDFSKVGNSISSDTSAFDKIKKFSRSTSFNINKDVASGSSTFSKINNLYLCGPEVINNGVSTYGSYRQHTLSSSDSLLPSYSTLVDRGGLNKFYSYSLGIQGAKTGHSSANIGPETAYNSNVYRGSLLSDQLQTQVGVGNLLGVGNPFFTKWLLYHPNNYTMNLSDDAKSYGNPFKTFFKSKNAKKVFIKDHALVHKPSSEHVLDELVSGSRVNFYS